MLTLWRPHPGTTCGSRTSSWESGPTRPRASARDSTSSRGLFSVFLVFACISPPYFCVSCPVLVFCSVLVRPTYLVFLHLWGCVLGSHVVCAIVLAWFFVIACSFLVSAICSAFWYSFRLFVSFVTRLALCYFVHCRSFASGVMVFCIHIFPASLHCLPPRVFLLPHGNLASAFF